ncbi:MAG: hypothetical protein BEN19_00985 [Epulopiscium sp. Nuni2H_MBin003]|nr:MAG: hypothetical protein BEN19_00985 [Epulopiscium sp. Nuni2H_MBin003]
MNDNKALNYLLSIFIILNIILAFGNYYKYVLSFRLSPERLSQITAYLEQNDIHIVGDLPTNYASVASITISPIKISTINRDILLDNIFGEKRQDVTITEISSQAEYDNKHRVYKKDNITLTFSTYQVAYTDSSISINYTSTLTKDLALDYAKAYFNAYYSTIMDKKVKISYKKESYGALITYYEIYNNLPIFDSYMYMQITDDGVFMSTMALSEVKEESINQKEIYGVDQVLFNLQEIIKQSVNNQTYINDITIGYKRDVINRAFFLKEEAHPTYKIDIVGLNTPLYVNAYTNELK